jgi:tetratricopeptide (TPR) repeat protein
MLSRHFAGLVVLLATFLALSQPQAAPAAEGKADDADPAAKVQKLNRYAMELFDEMNFPLAEKTLLEALAVVEKSNLGSGPAGLATNGNLAVLYSVGLKNPEKAVFHFKKALAVKPDLKMSKQRATPETEANLARAKADMGGATPAPKPAERAVESKRTEPATASALKCPTGGAVQAGDEITLKCVTSTELDPAAVILHYKPNSEEQYQSLEMTKAATAGEPTSWVAKIPGSATKAKWISIYFEAQNGSGAIVALSGRDDSPSMITVQGAESTAAAPVAAGEGEESAEEEEEEVEDIDDNNPLARLEGERRREHEGSRGTWWVSLGFGSGFGYAHGTSTEAFGKDRVGFTSGFALANLGQAVPEVGYFIGRSTALSLTGRLQAIFPRGPEGTATGALTGLLRILFFSDDEGKFRWYFAGAAGAGEDRH